MIIKFEKNINIFSLKAIFYENYIIIKININFYITI